MNKEMVIIREINVSKLISKMDQRMKHLQQLIDRDISGNTQTAIEAWREVKYWKEAIERGEFDTE